MANLGEANIGGRMVPAWLMNITAEELDSLKSRWYSNPNLLDNWYFGNPVNQRGQTSYTGGGYTIDRWKLNTGYTLTLGPNGIKLKREGDYALALTQIVDNPSDLAGETVTFSVLIDDTTALSSQRITINANEATVSDVYFSGGNKLAFVTTTLPEELSDLQIRFLNYSNGSEVTYKAVKLELGDQQTLAHQENGVWVLNEIPDYGEQLARCQRVLIPVLPWVCYSGRIDNSGTAYIEIPTPVSMRSGDVPVIIGAKNGLVYHASGLKDVTYGVVSFGANSVTIFASGLGITNQVCSGCFANKVFLSKEL